METIGLIAAMPQESGALLHYIRRWRRISIGPLRGNIFELSGLTCVLVTSGMGIRRASEATRALVKTHSPRLLISFGIAGAVGADLEIGDVVLAEAVCQLYGDTPEPLLPLKLWSDAARESAAKALARRGACLYPGTAITTGGSQVMEYRLGEMTHPILEMETAGIAQVATESSIPLLSLRSISDGPRAPIPIDLGEMMDEDSNLQARKLLKAVIHNPRIVFQSRRMIRNSRIAADNAAFALVVALSQMALG